MISPILLALMLTSPPQGPCRVTSVANAGVLLESGAARLLIDAPIRGGIPPYATPTAGASRQLESASAPFDRITAILITHWHEDHFSAEAVAAHLTASPRTVLITSAEIVERVRKVAPALASAQFRPMTPAAGAAARTEAGGLPIHVLRIRHSPARRMPEEHVGFLIEGCRTVLHTGDAEAQAGNFALLKDLPRVEVGLLPYWFLLGGTSRAFVETSIRPGRVLAMHIPPSETADVASKLPSTTVALTRPGQRIELR
jgi:L-ascorbate metabolism protein UlaG (beta-lactamase superfamily)